STSSMPPPCQGPSSRDLWGGEVVRSRGGGRPRRFPATPQPHYATTSQSPRPHHLTTPPPYDLTTSLVVRPERFGWARGFCRVFGRNVLGSLELTVRSERAGRRRWVGCGSRIDPPAVHHFRSDSDDGRPLPPGV